MQYNRQNLEIEWTFVCRSIPTELVWSNVFYGGKVLPKNFHEMGLATIMVQIWQCFMREDCLNILMIARFTKELVVLNGGGKCMLIAHVLILDEKY